MKLGIIMVTEISQTPKDKHYVFLFRKRPNIEVRLFGKRKGTQHKWGWGKKRGRRNQYNQSTLERSMKYHNEIHYFLY